MLDVLFTWNNDFSVAFNVFANFLVGMGVIFLTGIVIGVVSSTIKFVK